LAAQLALTAALIGAAALVAASSVVPGLGHLASPLADALSVSLDFLYRLVVSNEGILAVGAVVLVAGALRGPVERLTANLAGGAITLILYGFLSLLALVAQAYVLTFAGLANAAFLGLTLAVGAATWFVARRLTPADEAGAEEPGFQAVPLPVFLGWLALYLHIGMVQGHLATPVVHHAAAAMAALSAASPLAYRAAGTALMLLPLIPWLPRLRSLLARGGRAALIIKLAPAALLLPLALPTTAAPYVAALLVASATGATLATAGLLPLRLAHPDPRKMLARLSLVASLALTAATAHYLATTWNCAHSSPLHPAVRLLSSEPGTFDLVSTADGEGLLVSLREPRRVIRLDLAARSAPRQWVTAEELGPGSGHLFSWTEPENILPVPGRDTVLLLKAVSDDEELNQVLRVSPGGEVRGVLRSVPRGGVSDMITDGAGTLYLSQEFSSTVYQVDATTLKLTRTIHWPDAETNKVEIDRHRRRLYSLGLWFDPYLRAMDLGESGHAEEAGRLELGTLNWDMALDPRTGRLFIPKFVSGEVLVIQGEHLKIADTWPAGFGARAVDLDPDRRLLFVGSMHASRVTVFDLDRGDTLLDLRLGGYIKGLHVNRRTHKAYVGCACGVYEIDADKLMPVAPAPTPGAKR